MKRKLLVPKLIGLWTTISLWCSCLLAATTPPPANLAAAKWIWFAPAAEAGFQSLPAGLCYFRAGLTIPQEGVEQSEKVEVAWAELIITADNLYTVYLNGQGVGESETDPHAWSKPKRFDVTSLIDQKYNIVAVEAANTAPGPAGLLVNLVVQWNDGNQMVLTSDSSWKGNNRQEPGWQLSKFDDTQWQHVTVVGEFGMQPWGKLAVPATRSQLSTEVGKVRQVAKGMVQQAMSQQPVVPVVQSVPPADYRWPLAVLFVGDDCSLVRPATHSGTSMDSLTVTIFNARNSRAFPEHDLPAPMKVGRKLMVLKPARPGVTPRLLLDAGAGAIGSPSVSFDGMSIFISMARAGDFFFPHLSDSRRWWRAVATDRRSVPRYRPRPNAGWANRLFDNTDRYL